VKTVTEVEKLVKETPVFFVNLLSNQGVSKGEVDTVKVDPSKFRYCSALAVLTPPSDVKILLLE
jgi:hypothetical protein